MTWQELGEAYIKSREGLGLDELSEESGRLWRLYMTALNAKTGALS